MKQENKNLLLKELCARLHYGLKVKCGNTVTKEICELIGINAEISTVSIRDRWAKHYLENVASIKPYLRPMSSMTEEERYKYFLLAYRGTDFLGDIIPYDEAIELIDWLNAHHFDYRGLIEKGLALEVPEGMYNIN